MRERIDAAGDEVARLICEVIAEDTGLPDNESMLLASGLAGLAQTAARHWLQEAGTIPRDAAAALVARLSWRGISGVPRQS